MKAMIDIDAGRSPVAREDIMGRCSV